MIIFICTYELIGRMIVIFGTYLDKLRAYTGLSINKLGENAGVSPTYISRIQNNPDKKPSKKVFLKITYAFMTKLMAEENKNNSEIKKLYANYMRSFITDNEILNSEEQEQLEALYKETTEYFEKTFKEKATDLFKLKDRFYKNLFLIHTSGNKVEVFDSLDMNTLKEKPLFDLKWLLTQDKYEIFYGRERLLTDSKEHLSIDYNTISKGDKEIIFNIIDSYIKTKYMRLDDPEKFFNNIFKNILTDKED